MKTGHLLLLSFALLLWGCTPTRLDEPTPPPIDNFDGDNVNVELGEETANFRQATFTCYIKAEDGTIIIRRANHKRINNRSHIKLEQGIRDGKYRLLYFEYDLPQSIGNFTTKRHGVGHLVQAKDDSLQLLSHYDSRMGLVVDNIRGNGSAENPYIVCCDDDILRIQDATNVTINRWKITTNTYFKQVWDIDMGQASYESDTKYGWDPIGNSSVRAFLGHYDGNGHSITGLNIKRIDTNGVGLFGYVTGSTMKNIHLKNSTINGGLAVGGLVGGVVTEGYTRAVALLRNCTVENSKITSSDLNSGIAIGGLLGMVDIYSGVLIDSCRVIGKSTEISGAYGVGGLIGSGATSSSIVISNSRNESGTVRGGVKCIGGIVGTADTLSVYSCLNQASITGGLGGGGADVVPVGVGGIAGGGGVTTIIACANEGSVTGKRGVGGIMGSTLTSGTGSDGDPYIYNTAVVMGSKNSGAILGEKYVGGICGEAQLGGYGSYNKANVTATSNNSFVGGISGGGSITVLNNCHNFGAITGNSNCGGISGAVIMGSLANLTNYGQVIAQKGHAGGIVGLAGSYSMLNYCGNFASIQGGSDGYVGGIVGEVGEKRKWTNQEIASCVFASVEAVVSLVGGGIAMAEAQVASKTLARALSITGTTIGRITLAIDGILGAKGAIGCLINLANPAEMDKICLDVKNSISRDYKLVASEINSEIDSKMASLSNHLPQGLAQTGISSDYNQSRKSLVSFFESSEDNQKLFNDNINLKREERYDDVQDKEQVKQVLHSIVTGVCLVTSVGLMIGSGGTATPAIVVVGFVMTGISFGNVILDNLDNLKENVAVVSQCVNYGDVGASGSSTGGIIGKVRQNVKISDCLNAGNGKGSGTGSIAGSVEEQAVVHNSLNIGQGWGKPLFGGTPPYFHDKNNFYLNNSYGSSASDGNKIDKNQLQKSGTFGNWDLTKNRLWKMTSQYPVPDRSEMQVSIK